MNDKRCWDYGGRREKSEYVETCIDDKHTEWEKRCWNCCHREKSEYAEPCVSCVGDYSEWESG